MTRPDGLFTSRSGTNVDIAEIAALTIHSIRRPDDSDQAALPTLETVMLATKLADWIVFPFEVTAQLDDGTKVRFFGPEAKELTRSWLPLVLAFL